MTTLAFDDDGVDVVYEGTEFRLDRELVSEAIGKPYRDVTDHEVLQIVAEHPEIDGEPRRVGDLLD